MKKTALITGASRGIGRAIALHLASYGYDIVITCLKNTDLLCALKVEIEQKWEGRCLAYTGDLGDSENVRELFELIYSSFDSLDIIVNNAGISHIGLFTETSPSDWKHILDTNLNSAYYCCYYGVPPMIAKQKGKIINISSVWGCVGSSCEVAYSAAKGGLNSFTKALAKELAPSNIQVNAIACGAIDTEMNEFLSEEDRLALIGEIPADRFGRPEEVAELVYSLCSGNDYLTGQVILLDGGWI